MYQPTHLKRWKLPKHYFGAEWPNHYVFLAQTRDSDELTQSNFATALGRLEALPEVEGDEDSRQVIRESHCLVGWVEWIAIHKDDASALRLCDSMLSDLEGYPILDEDDFSQREHEAANQVWKDCYRVSERAEYIRKHPSQFEFHDYADMLACVRGKYFSGYASELIVAR